MLIIYSSFLLCRCDPSLDFLSDKPGGAFFELCAGGLVQPLQASGVCFFDRHLCRGGKAAYALRCRKVVERRAILAEKHRSGQNAVSSCVFQKLTAQALRKLRGFFNAAGSEADAVFLKRLNTDILQSRSLYATERKELYKQVIPFLAECLRRLQKTDVFPGCSCFLFSVCRKDCSSRSPQYSSRLLAATICAWADTAARPESTSSPYQISRLPLLSGSRSGKRSISRHKYLS